MSVDKANGKLFISNYHQLTSVATNTRSVLVSYDFLGVVAIVFILIILAVQGFLKNTRQTIKGKSGQVVRNLVHSCLQSSEIYFCSERNSEFR